MILINSPMFVGIVKITKVWAKVSSVIASTTWSFSLVLSSFLIDHSYSKWTTNSLADLFSYSTSLHSFLFSKQTLLAKRSFTSLGAHELFKYDKFESKDDSNVLVLALPFEIYKFYFSFLF
jgi:hypothetical protein